MVAAAVISSEDVPNDGSSEDPGPGEGPDEWFDDDTEVDAVAAMLAGCGWLDPGRDLADFRREPWRWSAVRELWHRSGRPTAADQDWDLFLECLD